MLQDFDLPDLAMSSNKEELNTLVAGLILSAPNIAQDRIQAAIHDVAQAITCSTAAKAVSTVRKLDEQKECFCYAKGIVTSNSTLSHTSVITEKLQDLSDKLKEVLISEFGTDKPEPFVLSHIHKAKQIDSADSYYCTGVETGELDAESIYRLETMAILQRIAEHHYHSESNSHIYCLPVELHARVVGHDVEQSAAYSNFCAALFERLFQFRFDDLKEIRKDLDTMLRAQTKGFSSRNVEQLVLNGVKCEELKNKKRIRKTVAIGLYSEKDLQVFMKNDAKNRGDISCNSACATIIEAGIKLFKEEIELNGLRGAAQSLNQSYRNIGKKPVGRKKWNVRIEYELYAEILLLANELSFSPSKLCRRILENYVAINPSVRNP